jgi:Ca2+-binding EF-hand superfamily protein
MDMQKLTHYKAQFMTIDADGNGFISVDELANRFNMTKANALEILRTQDLNNDNVVSFEEVSVKKFKGVRGKTFVKFAFFFHQVKYFPL